MTDQPYTPSKHLVGYAYVRTNAIKAPEHELWDEYHGFIAAIEAAAEQRGLMRGWDEGCAAGLGAGLTIGEISMGLKERPIPAEPKNPYRADQIEQENNDE